MKMLSAPTRVYTSMHTQADMWGQWGVESAGSTVNIDWDDWSKLGSGAQMSLGHYIKHIVYFA